MEEVEEVEDRLESCRVVELKFLHLYTLIPPTHTHTHIYMCECVCVSCKCVKFVIAAKSTTQQINEATTITMINTADRNVHFGIKLS